MNFHDPAMAAGGKVVLLTGPFGDAERTISLDRPMAIAEVIAEQRLTFRLPTLAVMDGEPVMRGQWALRVVRPGEVLAFVAVPRGGGQGGNSQGKQIAGMVAALALSIAAPMIGGWAAGALFGGSALAANLVTAAVMVGGGLLLNALFPPPQETSQSEAEQVYSVNAASNQATPLDLLPDLYGRLRFAPRHASRPYSEFQGNDQYLYQLFLVTVGKADVPKIEIGETEAWSAEDGYSSSFSDLEFEIIQPGDPITLFPANVVTAAEVSGQTVPDAPGVLGPFVVNAAGTTVDRLAVDFAFPRGLFTADNKGVASNSIALRAQYQQIDDEGDPVGGWSNVFAETISAATRTPQRMSRSKAVAPARYQVRFLADEAFDPDDGTAVNAVAWTGLRGYLTDFVTPPNCTLLAMKIRANEQLSQFASNQIRVTAERYLPVWDGEAGEWVEQKTRSIAWAAADVLMNTDYSIGLTESQIDLASLALLDATWEGRGDHFDAIFDRPWTVQEALRAILRAGRSQPVRLGGRIGFTRLEPKQIKRAVFTPRNVVRGSFQHKLVLNDEEKPDSVLGSYIDGTTWQTREVLGSLASVGSDLPQKLEWFGITDHDHCWRETVTEAAVNAYCREFVSFTADWEGKLLVRGEPILVHHPFISLEAVQVAALASRDGDELTLDRALEPASWNVWDDGDAWDDEEPWELTEALKYFVILRGRDGREWGPCEVAYFADGSVVLDAADRALVETAMGDLDDILPGDRAERMHVLLCNGLSRPFNGLVVSATPAATGKVDILAVIDAPEVYLADATEVMPSPWTPPVLPPQNPARPLLLGLYAELRPGIAQLELDAMWQPSAGAIGGYVAEVSYDDDALVSDAAKTWTPVFNGRANRFTVPVLPQKLVLRVAAVGVLQGPWTKKVFSLGDVPQIVIGPIGPEDLTDELNDQRAEAMRTIEQMQADRSRAIAQMADALAGRVVDLQTYRQQVSAQFQDTTAAYTLEITAVAGTVGALVDRTELLEAVVADPVTGLVATATALDTLRITVTADLEATAEDIEALEVKAGDVSAGYLLAARVTAAPSGWDGAIQFGLRGEEGGEPSWVGLMIVRKNDGTGRIYLDADETIFRGKSRSVSGLSFIDWETGAQRWGG